MREVIVVEGPSDVSAVRQAVDAELIATGGFGLDAEILQRIRVARERRGVVVLTDPDHAGEQIRRRVEAGAGPCKHAWIPRADCTRDGDVGVENARPEVIRAALSSARVGVIEVVVLFTTADLLRHRLTGVRDAAERRAALGRALGIGRSSAAQLLRRLNHYGITREEFESAMRTVGAGAPE